MKVQERFEKLVTWGYKLIFRSEPSKTVLNLSKVLSFVFIGFVLSRLFAFLFQVIAGRVLGPEKFGEFTLVQTISTFLFVSMLWGINVGFTKYASETKRETIIKKVFSNSVIMIALFSGISVAIYYAFGGFIAEVLKVDYRLFLYAIALALGNALFTFARNIAQGLKKYKVLTSVVLIRSVVALLLLGVLFFVYLNYSVGYVVGAMIIGYLLAALVVVPFCVKYFSFVVDKSMMKQLFEYGSYNAIAVVSIVVLTYIDNLFVNYYLGTAMLGIYQVYYLATMVFVELFVSVFTSVLFPETTARDKRNIWNKTNRLFILLPVVYGVVVVVATGVVWLFGTSYPFSWRYIFMFALSAVISLVYYLYASFFNATGIEGSKHATFAIVIASVLNVFLNMLLIPQFALYGAIISTIISFSFMAGYLYLRSERIITNSRIDNKI